MTIAFVPASILQGSRRFEVLEPLVERALSPDRVLLLHPPSGKWVIVRAESLAGDFRPPPNLFSYQTDERLVVFPTDVGQTLELLGNRGQ